MSVRVIFGVILLSFVLISVMFQQIGTDRQPDADSEIQLDDNSDTCRVAKPTGNGPYSSSFKVVTVGGKNAKIWFPGSGSAVSSSGAPYPTIIFSPGNGMNEATYDGLLSVVATWGIICMCLAANNVNMSLGLDFFEAENALSGSTFYNKINISSFGASGHSGGGKKAIISCTTEPRFKAVTTLAAATIASATPKFSIPMQLIAGSTDTAHLNANTAGYNNGNIPKSMIVNVGGGHGAHPNDPIFLTAFFKFWLAEEFEYYEYVYGDDIEKSVNAGSIEFSSELGISATLKASKLDVTESEVIKFEGNCTLDPVLGRTILRYEWDLDGDGVFETQTDSPNFNKTCLKSGDIVVKFRGIDSWHLQGKAQNSTVVTNILPIADAYSNLTEGQSIFEDQTVTFYSDKSYDTPGDLENLTYSWDFDDGSLPKVTTEKSIEHTFKNAGVFTPVLTVQDDNYEIDTDAVSVITVINVDPICWILEDEIHASEDETITIHAGAQDTPSDYWSMLVSWNMGDGTYKNLTNVNDITKLNITHIYNKENTYEVKLTVTDDNGIVAQTSVDVSVTNVDPTIDFIEPTTASVEIDEDEVILFHCRGNDSASDVGKLSYKWDFGDGNITDWQDGLESKKEYIYPSQGKYPAIFYLKDDDGIISNSKIDINVNNVIPNVSILNTKSQLNESENIVFQGIGSDTSSDQDSLMFKWDFGDGSVSSWVKTAIVNKYYNESGTFTVSLTVIDDDEATSVAQFSIVVKNMIPVAVISADKTEINEDESIFFDASQSTDTKFDFTSLKYEWNIFGKTFNEINVSYTFENAGQYPIKLTVEDNDGEKSINEIFIDVNNVKPVANIVADRTDVKVGDVVILNGNGSTDSPSDKADLIYEWDFRDGELKHGSMIEYTFTKPGVYDIILKVTDDNSATDEAIIYFEVAENNSGLPPDEVPNNSTESKSSFGTMLMFGLIIGIVLVLLVAIIGCLFFIKRSKKQKEDMNKSKQYENTPVIPTTDSGDISPSDLTPQHSMSTSDITPEPTQSAVPAQSSIYDPYQQRQQPYTNATPIDTPTQEDSASLPTTDQSTIETISSGPDAQMLPPATEATTSSNTPQMNTDPINDNNQNNDSIPPLEPIATNDHMPNP